MIIDVNKSYSFMLLFSRYHQIKQPFHPLIHRLIFFIVGSHQHGSIGGIGQSHWGSDRCSQLSTFLVVKPVEAPKPAETKKTDKVVLW